MVIAVPNDVDSILVRRNRLCRKLGFKNYQSLGELGMPALSLDMAEIHLSHFRQRLLEQYLEALGFSIVDSGLDPYFAALGTRRLRRYVRYFSYGVIKRLTGKNLYDTIWITARKLPSN